MCKYSKSLCIRVFSVTKKSKGKGVKLNKVIIIPSKLCKSCSCLQNCPVSGQLQAGIQVESECPDLTPNCPRCVTHHGR